MSKEDVINYVMTTPGNPNRAVLEGMLEKNGDGGSGYSCYEEMVTLAEETVTTIKKSEQSPFAEGEITFEKPVTADKIHVTFDGTEYDCEKVVVYGSEYYGAIPDLTQGFDWSEYPFCLNPSNNMIATQTAGTYQVKVDVLIETVEVTDCFKKAVNASSIVVHSGESSTDKTWQEVQDAFVKEAPVYYTSTYRQSSFASKQVNGIGLFPLYAAEEIIDTKTGAVSYAVRGADGLYLVADTKDEYLRVGEEQAG